MITRFNPGLALICLALFTTSCLDDINNQDEQLIQQQDALILAYLDSNDIDATKTAYGVYYEVLKENRSGTAVKDGNLVYVHYVLRDLEGNFIDSLQATGDSVQTVRFYQHMQSVVPQGFYIGADLMHVGEKLRLYIPSYQAYQEFSYKTVISSHEALIAEVEIVKVEELTVQQARETTLIEQYIAEHALDSVQRLSSGIYYQRLSSGSGNPPVRGNVVEVAYRGLHLDGSVFDQSIADKPLRFSIENSNIIKGFEEGIKQMRKGEKARIFIPSHLAYGASVEVIPAMIREEFLKDMLGGTRIQPFTPIIFELELLDVQ